MQNKNNLLRRILSLVVNLPPDDPITPPAPLDPAAVAELEGSFVIGARRDQITGTIRPKPMAAHPEETPVDPGGHVMFDVLYHNARVPQVPFTAEQAIEAVTNVQKTIPDSVPEPSRKPMIKGMLSALAKSASGSSPEAIALDASNKIEALKTFVRERSNDLVDLQQAADDAIKALEVQIEAKKQLKEAASKQFESLAGECSDEQARLNALIDLLSLPE